jgi:hypothetical protein
LENGSRSVGIDKNSPRHQQTGADAAYLAARRTFRQPNRTGRRPCPAILSNSTYGSRAPA